MVRLLGHIGSVPVAVKEFLWQSITQELLVVGADIPNSILQKIQAKK
jgi:hypothetical protein